MSTHEASPMSTEWQKRIEHLRSRIRTDPNKTIAGYARYLKLVLAPSRGGELLLELSLVIEGAKGETRTHKRRIALGSLHYAIIKDFEEVEELRPPGWVSLVTRRT